MADVKVSALTEITAATVDDVLYILNGEATSNKITFDNLQKSITDVGTIASGTWGTGAVIGGATMTLGSDADVDIYYRSGGVLTRLPKGSALQTLRINAATDAIEWAAAAGGGDVSKVGTPVDSQVGVWTGDGTIEGTTGLTYDGSNLQLTGDIGSTGTRITKGWFTDLQVTNAIASSITGNAATVSTITGLAPDTATTQATQANITTCANLVTVGALNSGSITSGFGAIDNGASPITTTGAVTAGTIDLGNADTTLSRSAAGVLAVEGVDVPTISSTSTLTNKTIDGDNNTITNIGSLTQSITQTSHGFIVGDSIYEGASGYAKAQANASGTLGEFVVVAVADVNNFTLAKSGIVTVTTHGFTVDTMYYTSPTVAGTPTTTEPTDDAYFSNPMFKPIDANTLHILNFRPSRIGADVATVNTGTSTSHAVTPDSLAGSYAGTKTAQITCFDYTTDTATGNGKGYFHIPASLNGMNLVAVHAEVITAGTTGTTDIQIHNLTQTADMLSTVITIDSGETGSDTAATPAVIDTANDDVATNDLIRIDVDAVSTTAAKGLIVTCEFRLP